VALQWSQPSPPAFDRLPTVELSAIKLLGDSGDNVSLAGTLSLTVEGPTPDEDTVLGYLDVLYRALRADGWDANLRMEQTAVVRRGVEEAPEV
jgi:hypothetical protein